MKNMPYLQSFNQTTALPQPISHINQSYSLENDMILGWVPSYIQEEPMNIMYVNELNDEVIKYYQENNPEKIVYLGSRPTNTFQFHQQFQTQYKYYKSRFEKQVKMSQGFVGMNPKYKQPLQFNSIFEGGNLDLVINKSVTEFDLFMRVDTNTQGHNMWYYFEITGLRNYDQITLNICNFRKKRCLYERGMKPFIFRSQHWQQEGENVKYSQYRNQFSTKRQYFCLQFTLLNTQKDDSIKVAYCIPYTFTQLLNFLKEIDCKYFEQSTLCCSISGVAIPKLTLSKGSIMNKKVIVIQARIHPGESNSSWVMQGLIQYLTSTEAEQLLDIFIFVIIPMVNVDGVIFGNYRTGSAGRDLNRKFREPCKSLYPGVVAMKQLISELHTLYGEQLMGFFDIHGHSAKKNTFLYGPEFPIWNPNYYKSRLFAKILSKKTPIFRYFSCLFRINQCKINTARSIFCELYDFVNCFTIEVSNSSYYHEQNTFFFTNQNWIQFGYIIGESFYDFIQTYQEIDTIFYDFKEKKMNQSIKKKTSVLSNEEKEQKLKKICQNSKFSALLQEMQDETPNLSFSEGGSDSESDSDDLNDQQLQPILYLKTPKNKKNSLKITIDFPKIKRKKQNYTPQTVNYKIQEYIEQHPNPVFQPPNNQTLYRRSGYNQRTTGTKFREKQSHTQQKNYTEEMKNLTTYRATFQGGKQVKLEEIGHFSRNMSPIKIKTAIANMAKSQLEQNAEQAAEEIFQPFIKKKSIEKKNGNTKNNIVILHTPTQYLDQKKSLIEETKHYQTEQDSYSNVLTTIYHGLNHDIPQTKYHKKKNYQRSRNPTLALKNTLQIQKLGSTEESQGVIIKPRLFSSPQIEEQISVVAKQSFVAQKKASTFSNKTQKQSIPASFYQMKKHWANTRAIQQFVK